MSSLVILATTDSTLADAWERQLPAGRVGVRLASHPFTAGSGAGFAAAVVLDATCEPSLPATLAKFPTIFVGEPKSVVFEQARIAGRARAYLSYDESTTRLREFLPLLIEIAEKQSMVDMLLDKTRRSEPARTAVRPSSTDAVELWDFVEGAIESLDSRDRLIAEFRRASRHVLRASHAVFFFRDTEAFRADRGTSFFGVDDPLVTFFETHPAVIDGTNWDWPTDPVAELAVRNRLALWGARLLVPVHDNGRLLGLIALGVRDDGQSYDEMDRHRAVFFARLLRHFLSKSAQLVRLSQVVQQTTLGAKYLPGTLVLGADENAPRHVPLVVRDLIGQARRSREVCRVAPTPGQPFRASSGIITETGGVWAAWEEVSAEVHDALARERAARRGMLRDLALTLSHELGNALVSLATFSHLSSSHPLPPAVIENARADIARLHALNDHFTLMQMLHESDVTQVDVREIAQSLGQSLGVRVEVGPDPVMLNGSSRLLEFALRALVRTVAENRPDDGIRDLALKVRSAGTGRELTALVSLKGKNLELEGILPEPTPGGVPNQGRFGVFLAKEILRLHNGEIHAGPGMEGTEILMSFRSM
jgi:hypothetical protein